MKRRVGLMVLAMVLISMVSGCSIHVKECCPMNNQQQEALATRVAQKVVEMQQQETMTVRIAQIDPCADTSAKTTLPLGAAN